jgi:hypothetical protein
VIEGADIDVVDVEQESAVAASAKFVEKIPLAPGIAGGEQPQNSAKSERYLPTKSEAPVVKTTSNVTEARHAVFYRGPASSLDPADLGNAIRWTAAFGRET